jgi:hypothetical protein
MRYTRLASGQANDDFTLRLRHIGVLESIRHHGGIIRQCCRNQAILDAGVRLLDLRGRVAIALLDACLCAGQAIIATERKAAMKSDPDKPLP